MIAREKNQLRKWFREKRLALSEAEVAEKSQQICQNFILNLLPILLRHPELACPELVSRVSGSNASQSTYQTPSEKIFALYIGAENEASPAAIAEHFQHNSIKFSYAKIIEKNQPLDFILADNNTSFTTNKFYPKLLEPANGAKITPDFIILPLLAFDNNLARLGMGGGFYDRSIEEIKAQNPDLVTIGLAYEFQRSAGSLPVENTDQKLDFIVTEKNIFSRS